MSPQYSWGTRPGVRCCIFWPAFGWFAPERWSKLMENAGKCRNLIYFQRKKPDNLLPKPINQHFGVDSHMLKTGFFPFFFENQLNSGIFRRFQSISTSVGCAPERWSKYTTIWSFPMYKICLPEKQFLTLHCRNCCFWASDASDDLWLRSRCRTSWCDSCEHRWNRDLIFPTWNGDPKTLKQFKVLYNKWNSAQFTGEIVV